ncbi:DNA-binding response regulator [Nocardioides szechwanensis]|uniref:Two component transcriptional regulator, winged helix family n=1 Tax=Nocardioides szechwanensis TaxID=1005944 RepID=A0A1H0KFQ9_9ACTN|nr:response regulator transcription factor [Nocardioides szechwanensis]GEP35534.1 DNA-binding response regulator [Nocardioides szechwanensis]SDO54552.1 two component transcriptional regulator, winged helix family [Nocardioides szechwanensis]
MLVGVCEDDAGIRRLLREALRFAGHEVLAAHDGGEALRQFGAAAPVDLIVMDIGLPDSDGRDVTQALRSAGQTAPVLFLTALGSVSDRVSGFHAGGDDYLSKPFDVQELLLRVEALGRRGRPAAAHVAGLELDPTAHAVRTATGEVLLTPTEYRMLAAITSRPGEVVRRRTVVAAAWPDGAVVTENTVDSFIRRVRAKLDAVGSPVAIETVRGVGFRVR